MLGVFARKNESFLRFWAWERALQAQNLHFHYGFVGVVGYTVPGMKILGPFSKGKMSVFCVLGLGSEPCKLKIYIFTAVL